MAASFRFTCEQYLGLGACSFDVRLSILTGDETPMLSPRIRCLELAEQEMGRELHSRLDATVEGMGVLPGAGRGPGPSTTRERDHGTTY
jgi:uncharacterized protein YfdQ (DUF2303 family)